jgi:RHS repeat-associated protein
MKNPIDADNDNITDSFEAIVLQQQSYYPFGMMMPELQYSAEEGEYRYGFNGMERDDEVKGSGNSYDFGARMYDNRLGRWWSIDKHFMKYPFTSSYNFGLNNPLYWIDPDGNDVYAANKKAQSMITRSFNTVLKTTDFNEIYKFNKDGKLGFIMGNYDPSKFDPEQQLIIEEFNKHLVNNSNVSVVVHNSNLAVLTQDARALSLDGQGEATNVPQDDASGKGDIDILITTKEKVLVNSINDDIGSNEPAGTDKLSKSNGEAINFFHGVGHAINFAKGLKDNSPKHNKQTVGFENLARKVLGLTERKGESHGNISDPEGTKGSEEYEK